VTSVLFRNPMLGGQPPPAWTLLIPIVVLVGWVLVRR